MVAAGPAATKWGFPPNPTPAVPLRPAAITASGLGPKLFPASSALWSQRPIRPEIRDGPIAQFDLTWVDADHFPLAMSSWRGYVRGAFGRPFFCCEPVCSCYKPAARGIAAGLDAISGRGGTGRRAGFRFQLLKLWGFESLRPHQALTAFA